MVQGTLPPASSSSSRPSPHRGLARVLVVAGDEALLAQLEAPLSREGYQVELARDQVGAEASLVRASMDLCVVGMAPGDGAAVVLCRRLRQRAGAPILVVSTRASQDDAVAALEAGADDYLASPENRRELVARVRALLRRRSKAEPIEAGEILVVGDVRLDPARHRVWVRDMEVTLPLKEFDLLELLLANAGRVLSRSLLINRVWGSGYGGDGKTLEVHVGRLRAKVEQDPPNPTRILTVRGLGYRYRAHPR